MFVFRNVPVEGGQFTKKDSITLMAALHSPDVDVDRDHDKYCTDSLEELWTELYEDGDPVDPSVRSETAVATWLKAHPLLFNEILLLQIDLQSKILGASAWQKISERRYANPATTVDPFTVMLTLSRICDRYDNMKLEAVQNSQKIKGALGPGRKRNIVFRTFDSAAINLKRFYKSHPMIFLPESQRASRARDSSDRSYLLMLEAQEEEDRNRAEREKGSFKRAMEAMQSSAIGKAVRGSTMGHRVKAMHLKYNVSNPKTVYPLSAPTSPDAENSDNFHHNNHRHSNADNHSISVSSNNISRMGHKKHSWAVDEQPQHQQRRTGEHKELKNKHVSSAASKDRGYGHNERQVDPDPDWSSWKEAHRELYS